MRIYQIVECWQLGDISLLRIFSHLFTLRWFGNFPLLSHITCHRHLDIEIVHMVKGNLGNIVRRVECIIMKDFLHWHTIVAEFV